MLREPSANLAGPSSIDLGAGFRLDIARGELLDGSGRPTELRAQALQVLLVLGERAGEVVGKDELLRRVWRDVVVTEDSIVQAIGDIRRVLGDTAHERIRTLPRRGYMLAVSPVEAAGLPDPAPPVAAPARHRVARGVLMALLVGAAILLVVLQRAGPASPPPRSLAILPFESEPPDATDAWLVDAVTADLHTDVARWRSGLTLIGRGTMARYRGKSADPREVGRELGVANVLTGRVRREGGRLRIAVEIVETASGRVVWARPFDIERTELPGSIGDIAGGIAKALMIDLGDVVARGAPRRLDAAQADAEDLAMRGFSVHLKGISPENLAQARALFEQAVALDPKSTRGLAGLSMTHSMDVSFTFSKDPSTSMRHAKEALDRLEAIDPHSQEALLARGSYLLSAGDWAGQFENALELTRHFPNDPTSHHHRCSSLLRLGRFDESIPACERAIRISPNESRTPIWTGLIGMNEFMRGNYKAAAERARVPATSNASVPFYALLVAVALACDGRADEARAAFDEFIRKNPTWNTQRIVRGWLNVDDLGASRASPEFIAGLQRVIATARELGLP